MDMCATCVMSLLTWSCEMYSPFQSLSKESCTGFQPVFQKSRSSSHLNHSMSVHDNNRIARLSSASLLTKDSDPLSRHSCHSTCICLIVRFASSGLSKFLSHMSRSSNNHVLPSLVMGSKPFLEGAFLEKGHHPISRRGSSTF